MRAIVVGDIHGCLEEFDELLKKVEFKKGKDTLVLAGDLIDRGPDSHGVLVRAKELEATVVMGNHDEKHLRFFKHELKAKLDPDYKNPMEGFRSSASKMEVYNSLTVGDFNFISTFRPFYRLGMQYIVVHGGLEPKSPEEQLMKDMVRRRFIDNNTGKMVKFGKDYSQPKNSHFWAERWDGMEIVIYGHHVHNLTEPTIIGNTVGLDTGACFGGYLSAALLLDYDDPMGSATFEIASVKAKKAYKESVLNKKE